MTKALLAASCLMLLAGSAAAADFGDDNAPATVKATPKAGPTELGVPASSAYRTALLAKARAKLVNAGPGADGKCSNLRASLAFVEKNGAKPVDAASYIKEVDAVLADVEVLFVKNEIRAKWIGDPAVPLKINQTAKAIGVDPALRATIAKGCQCKVGADPKKPLIVVFNNTGDETGFESSPVEKLNTTAPHELLHLVLPRLGAKSVPDHHGLTDYLGWGGGVAGNFVPFRPGASCKD